MQPAYLGVFGKVSVIGIYCIMQLLDKAGIPYRTKEITYIDANTETAIRTGRTNKGIVSATVTRITADCRPYTIKFSGIIHPVVDPRIRTKPYCNTCVFTHGDAYGEIRQGSSAG